MRRITIHIKGAERIRLHGKLRTYNTLSFRDVPPAKANGFLTELKEIYDVTKSHISWQ